MKLEATIHFQAAGTRPLSSDLFWTLELVRFFVRRLSRL